MIKKIKQIISPSQDTPEQAQAGSGEEKKIILIDPGSSGPPEPDMRVVGLFADVNEEKIAEILHNMLFFNEVNIQSNEDDKKPITFYLSTYGGNADDMFAMYDMMRKIRETTEIHTVGLGKVMSAGVLMLAAGTKGKRTVGKNCRIMIHSVMGGNHGSLHNMMNEMEAIEQLQDMYCDALISETKLTRVKLKKMLERKVNVYLSAEEAVELGIADEII
jgi:ATP-dependent Clp protease protease subunit